MLLEHGLTKEALAAFEATLNKEPHRLAPNSAPARPRRNRATPDKARAHYAAAVALTPNADPVRPQIAQARAFVQGGGTR